MTTLGCAVAFVRSLCVGVCEGFDRSQQRLCRFLLSQQRSVSKGQEPICTKATNACIAWQAPGL